MTSPLWPEREPDGRPITAEQPAIAQRQRSQPVLVTGASGMVGSHTCQELTKRGVKVRALVRSPKKAAIRLAHLPVDIRVGDIRDADAVASAVAGCSAVVHLVAIAIEKDGERYEDVNTAATRVLLEAAKQANVKRFIHMSQNGATSQSKFRFTRSKGIAEDLVCESDRDWTVLRPSVIFGREDEFVNVLARVARLSPGIFPLPGGGAARFQPISADDVARAIAVALERNGTIRQRYEIGGPAALTLRQMVERILLAMDMDRVLVGVPVGVLRPLVALLQRLLPNPPVTTGLLDLLALDNSIRENAMKSAFGIVPTPFAPEELRYLRDITWSQAAKTLFTKP